MFIAFSVSWRNTEIETYNAALKLSMARTVLNCIKSQGSSSREIGYEKTFHGED